MVRSETVKFCDSPLFNPNVSFESNLSFPHFNFSDFPSPFGNASAERIPEEETYNKVHYYAYNITLPIIFSFGVIANILNIIIFSKSRFRHSLDEVEKSATAGK